MRTITRLTVLLAFPFFFSCSKDGEDAGTIITTDFNDSLGGWTADFADYPAANEATYELQSGHEQLPAPLNQSQRGFRLSGNNHSDDLFMFIKSKISGLEANKTYKAFIEVQFASNAPSGTAGGAPGESVFLKAGFTTIEPVKELEEATGYYRMNIDKSNQGNSGADLKVIGNIANGKTAAEYTLLELGGESNVFTVQSNEAGEVWVTVGTDSGFEGATTLYYRMIGVRLVPQ
ncbi:MAG: hypothetical protein P0Y53_15545 [Candidatus Pseudobacter hemicellulosilyticus]|uniref:Lipoprotein n=1 Tax=Candidatus Pseudobacter hemicellulosilyticus TaxID=3121375 RepID=A0AAJ5WQI1_9BACT|nr:MAG: hypothetical protein P0Y53_15545 [Pseudobacter sp.]